MAVITIESSNYNLINEVWTLEDEPGVTIRQTIQRGQDIPSSIKVIFDAAIHTDALLLTVMKVLSLVKSHHKKKKKRAKVKIDSSLTQAQLRQLIDECKPFANIESLDSDHKAGE
jgi:hypothetical protein